jgi:hypothetical protein
VYGLSKSESRVLRWRLHERTGCTVLGAHTEAVTAICFEAPAPSSTVIEAVAASSTTATTTADTTDRRGSGRGSTTAAAAAAAAAAASDSAIETAAAAASGPVIISAALDGTVRAWQTLGATCTEKWKACANTNSSSSNVAANATTAARTATGRE